MKFKTKDIGKYIITGFKYLATDIVSYILISALAWVTYFTYNIFQPLGFIMALITFASLFIVRGAIAFKFWGHK